MKIIERTFNAETGETVEVERDETAQETKARLDAAAAAEAAQAAQALKAAEKSALLTRLGITAEEAKLLLQ